MDLLKSKIILKKENFIQKKIYLDHLQKEILKLQYFQLIHRLKKLSATNLKEFFYQMVLEILLLLVNMQFQQLKNL